MQAPIRRTPRQERSRARVAAILDAAAEEFADASYASATTTAIAARAGVPIGSLYQYFPDKEALLYGIADRHLTEGGAVLLDALTQADAAPDLAGAIRILVEAAVAANAGDPRLHHLLYREAPRPPELQARLADLEDALAAWVADILVRHRACSRRAAPLRARALVVAVEALVHDVVLDPPQGASRRRATDEVVAVALAMATA